MDIRSIHEGNRDAWNRTARNGYGAAVEEDVSFLKSGGTNLMAQEVRLLGNLGNCQRAIHLQCSHGFDTLSLLQLGVYEVVGIDISEEMLRYARQKSDALNANATWVRSDVLDAPHEFDGTADLVYTGRGAICWMADLDAWAAVVYRLLKPGGRLFLFEGHPLDFCWEEEAETYVLREGASYFQPSVTPEFGFPFLAAGTVDAERPVELTSRVWTIGQVVTSLIRSGLRIAHLEEFGEPFWDQFKHIDPEKLHRLPHTFAAIAEKAS